MLLIVERTPVDSLTGDVRTKGRLVGPMTYVVDTPGVIIWVWSDLVGNFFG
jgi:hypothetical protein